MVVISPYSAILVSIILSCSVEAYRRDFCHPETIARGRKNCIHLKGDFVFNNTNLCDSDIYSDVTTLHGTVVFDNIDATDPFACLSNLTMIIDETGNDYAIQIKENVRHMERFSWNKSLAIYSLSKKAVSIQNDYEMDAETYKNLAAHMGIHRINIKRFRRIGECYFKSVHIDYLSELDRCEIIVGDLMINSSLGSTTTRTELYKVTGCVYISGTSLTHEELMFLTRIRQVSCKTKSVITGNVNVCPSPGVLRKFAEAHVNLNETDRNEMIAEIMKNNGPPEKCATVCSAHFMDEDGEENGCEEIWGDFRLRSKYLPKLKKLTTIVGRFIVESWNGTDLFKEIPNLRLVRSMNSYEPAISITNCNLLMYINIPPNLAIITNANVSLRIQDNHFYRMEKEQYTALSKKYGKGKVEVDSLVEGECVFPRPLKHLDDIIGCDTIIGNLIVQGNIGTSTVARPRLVTGCIKINGTSIKYLTFLSNLSKKSGAHCKTGHAITNNKNLCPQVWEEKFKEFNNGQGWVRMMVHNNKDYCPLACPRKEMAIGRGCTVLTGAFNMPLEDHEIEEITPSLLNVESIHGPIKVRSTNITDFDGFYSLSEIVIDGDEPAIEIKDNLQMENFELRGLKEIVSSSNSSTLIRIRGNGNYKMPYKQYKKLVDKYTEDRLDIDYKEAHPWEAGLAVGGSIGAVLVICAMVVALVIAIRRAKYPDKKQIEEEPLILNSEASGKSGKKGFFSKKFGSIAAFFGRNAKGAKDKQDKGKKLLGPQGQEGALGDAPGGAGGVGGENGEAGGVQGADVEAGGEGGANGEAGAVLGDNQEMGAGALDSGGFASNMDTKKQRIGSGIGLNSSKIGVTTDGDTAVTARKANLGGASWQGNVLGVSKLNPVTAKTANIGAGAWDGNVVRPSPSVTGDDKLDGPSKLTPVTVKTAKIGNRSWDGKVGGPSKMAPPDSKLDGPSKITPVTVKTAKIGNSPWDGKVSGKSKMSSVDETITDASKINPVTAKSAMIGKEKWTGKMSTMQNAKTAKTAMIGINGKKWKGEKSEQAAPTAKTEPSPSIMGPKTAVTANIGKDKWTGGLKPSSDAVGVDNGGKKKSTQVQTKSKNMKSAKSNEVGNRSKASKNNMKSATKN